MLKKKEEEWWKKGVMELWDEFTDVFTSVIASTTVDSFKLTENISVLEEDIVSRVVCCNW